MAKQLVSVSNFDYMNGFMTLAKGRDWVDNIPQLTKDNIVEVGNAILSLKPARDMFYDEFILKIKEQIFGSLSADNKFKFLKGRNVDGIIEESYVDYIKGKNFDADNDTLLKNVKAKIRTLYHKIDRRLLYETSLSDEQMREAMLGTYGVSNLMAEVLNSLYESAEWDEFTMAKEMIVHNLQYAGKVVYLGSPKTEDGSLDYKALADVMLLELRKVNKHLQYVNRDHNILGLASATSTANQILVMHGDMNLNIDFASLSSIFNLDKVETASNMIEVDNFNENEYIVGAIMDRRGFQLRDSLRTTETFRNGQTLTTKYMHHIWQMMSYSYLRNTVYFVIGTEEEVKDKLGLKTKAELEAIIEGR